MEIRSALSMERAGSTDPESTIRAFRRFEDAFSRIIRMVAYHKSSVLVVDDNHMRTRSTAMSSKMNLPRKNNKTKRKFGMHQLT